MVQETFPRDCKIWNHWTGNGNSGMNAVAQANGIDKTQLNNGHHKQLKKRTSKISNLIHGMAEGAQLNVNVRHDDTLWLREFRDYSSVTITQMCFLKVPITASWSIGSHNGPATPFNAMGTQYGSFGKLEVSYEQSEAHRRYPDAMKLEFRVKESW